MRLFFALWPSPAAAERLASAATDAAARLGGRPTRLETLHLTLAFLGEVADERVFDRFYRRHGEEGLGSGGKSGSGLGLSIVRTIADRHGATVALSDARRGDASSGLRVTVLFPHAAHAGE